MKEGWEYKTLGECCEKINGLWKGKKEPFVNVGVIRNANFTKEMTLDFSNIEYLDVEVKQYNSRKLKRGDLIVEKSGGSEKQPVGRVVLFLKGDGEYSFSNFTSVLRIINKDELLYEFLYKFLLYIYRRGDTKSMQKATTGIHNIEFEKYLNIRVPIIPIDEQRRIVSYLDSSFQLIDKIKEKAQKSLSEAKALFQSALAEAMEPKEGWEENTLGDISDNTKNINWKYDTSTYKYIDLSSVDRDKSVISNTIIIDKTNAPTRAKQIVKYCDILFATTRPLLRRVTLIKKEYDESICSTGFCVIRPKKTIIEPHFVFYLFKDEPFYKYIEPLQNGANYPAVTDKSVKLYKFSYPKDISTQKQIVSHLDKLSSNVKQMEEKYQKIVEECDALKQAMLRDVFE